jgi:hypothetical protein
MPTQYDRSAHLKMMQLHCNALWVKEVLNVDRACKVSDFMALITKPHGSTTVGDYPEPHIFCC